jgi:hypothetical protein
MKKQFVRLAFAIVVICVPLTARAQTVSGKQADPVTGEPAAVSKQGDAESRKIGAGPVGTSAQPTPPATQSTPLHPPPCRSAPRR